MMPKQKCTLVAHKFLCYTWTAPVVKSADTVDDKLEPNLESSSAKMLHWPEGILQSP